MAIQKWGARLSAGTNLMKFSIRLLFSLIGVLAIAMAILVPWQRTKTRYVFVGKLEFVEFDQYMEIMEPGGKFISVEAIGNRVGFTKLEDSDLIGGYNEDGVFVTMRVASIIFEKSASIATKRLHLQLIKNAIESFVKDNPELNLEASISTYPKTKLPWIALSKSGILETNFFKDGKWVVESTDSSGMKK